MCRGCKSDSFNLQKVLLSFQFQPLGHISDCGHNQICTAYLQYLTEHLKLLCRSLIVISAVDFEFEIDIIHRIQFSLQEIIDVGFVLQDVLPYVIELSDEQVLVTSGFSTVASLFERKASVHAPYLRI